MAVRFSSLVTKSSTLCFGWNYRFSLGSQMYVVIGENETVARSPVGAVTQDVVAKGRCAFFSALRPQNFLSRSLDAGSLSDAPVCSAPIKHRANVCLPCAAPSYLTAPSAF